MSKVYAIYGASGFGKEVMPLVRKQFQNEGKFVFIDDGQHGTLVNGFPVLSFDEFLALQQEKSLTIAIANSKVRENLSLKCHQHGIDIFRVSHSSNIILDAVDLGPESLLCPNVMLTSNVIIGKAFHANIYSYVAHDCVIGDYVTFAPSVRCNGNIHIHDHAYIGTGAVIKQGTPEKPLIIGEGAIVGMGAVVTKDVEPYSVVVGNPARPLQK